MQNQFSDTKCCQFYMYDVAVGVGDTNTPNLPDDVRNVRNAHLHVLLCHVLLFPCNVHTCLHSGDEREIARDNNASTCKTKRKQN